MFIFKLDKPLFHLGQIVMTHGALEATDEAFRLKCLNRHAQGDWGIVGEQDWQMNDDAMIDRNRILSAYSLDEAQPSERWGAKKLWIITEADRSATTLLLPHEY